MDGKRIDWLARMMARGSDRRGALKTIAAGTLGGAALVQATAAHVGAQDAPGEDWVTLYEALAAAVDPVTGECGQVSDAVQQFHTQNAEQIAQMQADIATWSHDQVQAHQQAHGARVQQAAVAHPPGDEPLWLRRWLRLAPMPGRHPGEGERSDAGAGPRHTGRREVVHGADRRAVLVGPGKSRRVLRLRV